MKVNMQRSYATANEEERMLGSCIEFLQLVGPALTKLPHLHELINTLHKTLADAFS